MSGPYARRTSTLEEVKTALMTRMVNLELDLRRHRGEHQSAEGMEDRVHQRLAERIAAIERRLDGVL